MKTTDGAELAPDLLVVLRKVSIRLLPFLLILYIVSYLDRINLSFAALDMNQELRFSDESFGFGAGIFFLSYCLFGIPSNLVIEKLGPRLWISTIMVIWGIITVSMCLVHDPMTFYILRFALGAAEAGFFPGMLLYLTYWFPAKVYGTAVARFMTAIPLAGLLGSLVAAKAMDMSGTLGLPGWKWLFLVTGAPAILLGLLVPLLIPNKPGEAKWLSKEEAACLEAALPQKKAPAEDSIGAAKVSPQILSAFKSLAIWRFALLYFSLTIAMYGFQLWLPQIIKTFGSSNVETSLLSALPALFQALGMLLIAFSSDRLSERRFHVAAASTCTVLGLALTCLSSTPWIKLAGLCLGAFGIWGAVGPFWALARESLTIEAQGAGIAFINSVGNLGGFAGPYIVGLIKQYTHAFESSLEALGAAAIISAVLAVTSKNNKFREIPIEDVLIERQN